MVFYLIETGAETQRLEPIEYQLTSLTIVPEPTSLAVMFLAPVLMRRRR